MKEWSSKSSRSRRRSIIGHFRICSTVRGATCIRVVDQEWHLGWTTLFCCWTSIAGPSDFARVFSLLIFSPGGFGVWKLQSRSEVNLFKKQLNCREVSILKSLLPLSRGLYERSEEFFGTRTPIRKGKIKSVGTLIVGRSSSSPNPNLRWARVRRIKKLSAYFGRD
jgi:hypothetical protein